MNAAEIHDYWDERATLHPEKATTDDLLLRDLEFSELARRIERLQPRTVLDVGCGDGKTTLRLARRFPEIQFVGIDYSASMIALAMQLAQPKEPDNVAFFQQDLFDIHQSVDLIITSRVLINLESWDQQQAAIEHLLTWSKRRVLIENFVGPHNKLNELRRAAGLPEISMRPHNCYLHEHALERFHARSGGFADAYYFVTRLAYSRMCADTGEPIRYDHPICRAAAKLPQDIGLSVAPMRVVEL